MSHERSIPRRAPKDAANRTPKLIGDFLREDLSSEKHRFMVATK